MVVHFATTDIAAEVDLNFQIERDKFLMVILKRIFQKKYSVLLPLALQCKIFVLPSTTIELEVDGWMSKVGGRIAALSKLI